VAIQRPQHAEARCILSGGFMVASSLFSGEGKAMTTIPHLGTLGLVAALCLPISYHQIDFKMSSPDGVQRINELWFVTYVDDAGREILVQAKATTGEYVPLIAVDSARLESIIAAARGLAKANNVKMRLSKFSNRLDIEDISP
jgi:hypothetical protein